MDGMLLHETDRWMKEAGRRLSGDFVGAAAGDEGAWAWIEAEVDGGGLSLLRLQHFDKRGVRMGEPVQTELPKGTQRLALAAQGELYLVCWRAPGEIACATAGLAGTPLTPVFRADVATESMALAFGAQGGLLAWKTHGLDPAGVRITLQRLDARGIASGSPRNLPLSDEPVATALLAATTPGGFVLAAGDPVRLHWLDPTLISLGPPLSLDVPHNWSRGAIAAADRRVAVILPKPYGGTLVLAEAVSTRRAESGRLVTTQPLEGGFKEGVRAALRTDGELISALWLGGGFAREDTLWFQRDVGDTRAQALPASGPPLAWARVGQGLFVAFDDQKDIRIARVRER